MNQAASDLRRFIEEIHNRISLSSIVKDSVALTKKGREFQGLCPFHNEKTPSFYVNDEKGFYHCFGCSAHGDAFTFLEKTQRMSFREALEALAQKCGLTLPAQLFHSSHTQEERDAFDVLKACHQQAILFYQKSIQNSVLQYLNNRGLTLEDIQRFSLGFAPRGDQMITFLQQQNFTMQNMIDAGIVIHIPEENRTYPRFRDRIMFPIFNTKNQIIAFGGRAMGDEQPKYLNSPETLIFHKGKTLYGLNWALQSKVKSKACIVCEGYIDVIRLHKYGFTESVAPLGTALSEEQLLLLWKYWPEIIVCFDGDKAGQMAARRMVQRALPYVHPDRNIKILILPPEEDPDTYLIKNGRDAFAEQMHKATPLSEFLWITKSQEHPAHTPEGQAGLKKELFQLIQNIQDTTTRKAYEDFFKTKFQKNKPSAPPSFAYKKSAPVAAPIPQLLIDRTHTTGVCLLKTLLIQPLLWTQIADTLDTLEFHNSTLSEIHTHFCDVYAQEHDPEMWKQKVLDTMPLHLQQILNNPALDIHMRFFHRTQDLNTLNQAWNELFQSYQMLKNLELDLKNAYEDLHTTMSPSAWERIKTLQEMVSALRFASSSDI